jgi:hypothetical protein
VRIKKVEKKLALKLGYCQICAAFYNDRQMCGTAAVADKKHECQLGDKVIERWKKEYLNNNPKPKRR